MGREMKRTNCLGVITCHAGKILDSMQETFMNLEKGCRLIRH